VLTHGVRLDGRKFDEVRPIWIETGVLPRTHGSAVFTRGETQALVTCTLGTADDAQKIESFEGETVEELHAPLQLPAVLGRRGRLHARPGPPRSRPRALAERSLTPLMPPKNSSPTPCASSRTSSNRTAPRRWRRCAADRWR
jgi:polyribonucleotide nucleotidyltransferase